MKLCVLINSFTLGGAESVVLTLLEEYKKRGIDCTVVCMERNNFYQYEGGEILYLSKTSRGDEFFLRKFLMLPVYAFRLKSLLASKGLAVVQSHLPRANYVNVLTRLFGSRHKAQIVSHGIVSRYAATKSLSGKINLFLVKYFYRRADQLVFACHAMKKDYTSLGALSNDSCVINNPFDIEQISQKKSEQITEDEFLFKPNTKYVVSVGRLEKVKRIEDILDALSVLREKGHDGELLIVGDGPEREALKDYAKGLDLADVVHFVGRVQNPYKYIANSDILVSASASEGFGNVLVEALICGVPVVSSDCVGGPREILAPNSDMNTRLVPGQIESAEYGILVPVGDPQKIAEAVNELLSNTARFNNYSADGNARAKEFEASLIAEHYVEQLKSLSHA